MKSILLVDDAPAVLFSLRSVLEGENFKVLEAGDGVQALDILGTEAVDLIVTDLWMPKLDGVELLKRLRAGNATIKVIAITGGGPHKPIDVSAALAETWGADAVLHKPFDNADLINAINRLLPS